MLDLAHLERLLAEATPGKWVHRKRLDDGTPWHDVVAFSDDDRDWSIVTGGDPNLYDMQPSDAALIAAAVNALPELLAAARERDADRATIAQLQREGADYANRLDACRMELGLARAEVAKLRAVVEAARLCRCWHVHSCALVALDGKEGA